MDKKLDLLKTHLEDAIAAETNFEHRLRDFAADCDDEDVKASFLSHAAQAGENCQRLTGMVQELDARISDTKTAAASSSGAMPAAVLSGHIQEERTVQHLIMAYTLAAGSSSMYEGLRTVASASGETEMAALLHGMQARSASFAGKVFHFIPTRSIIAYNMLTIAEVDPSVETKINEASWTS
jgi:ferritin-like metal-binding protein YciE